MKIPSFFSYRYLFLLFTGIVYLPILSQGLSELEQRDLQIFTTYQNKSGVEAAINRTQTHIGHLFLKKQLANPINNIATLIDRQNITKALLIDSCCNKSFHKLLGQFALYEKSLTAIVDDNAIGKSVISNFYFKNKYLEWLNKYPVGLELGHAAHIANLSAPLLEHAIMHFLISEKIKNTIGGCCPGHDHHHHDCHHDTSSTGAWFAYNTYNVIHTLIHVIGFKGLIDHVRQQADIIQAMQQQLIDMRRCLESAKAIYDELALHPNVNKTLLGFDTLQTLFENQNPSLSSELQEFMALISTNTFEGEPSFFSRQGIILRAYALAQNVHQELQQKLEAIASLDFYMATAQLIREYQDTATPFSFAHYQHQELSHLEIQGFWNPLIANMQPIAHFLQLGDHHPSIAIVTGPNKAGKSTSLNAICIAILLAQTLGIAPASHCSLTPFASIQTGFNMLLRVGPTQSLFSASLDFANELLEYAKSHPSEFIFIAVDELFNSTDFERGPVIARRFAYALEQCPNCIACIATHFGSLTQLEENNPGHFKNFKAELTKIGNRSLYILEPGISDSRYVLELIEQNGLLSNKDFLMN